ncbi:hypothetical protein SAMN04488056_1285 [Cohaesibacter marisflavi]|uniref:Uncharacterized protein n=1 Tax=Cohaesibacter marisflavi TaxID=655353 RepID=A0A1I5NAW3_9HYPH|nr:hypothetical protein SAMN04488056_1285 [Cohaesibacter marisflavi]
MNSGNVAAMQNNKTNYDVFRLDECDICPLGYFRSLRKRTVTVRMRLEVP